MIVSCSVECSTNVEGREANPEGGIHDAFFDKSAVVFNVVLNGIHL